MLTCLVQIIMKEDNHPRIPELRSELEKLEQLEASKRPEWLNEWIRRSSPPSEAKSTEGEAAAEPALKEKAA